MKRKFAATLAEPVLKPGDWERLHGHRVGGGMSKRAALIPGASTKYLLSHCTIMSSVMVEPDPHDYLIKPECSHLVNNNDDAWTNEVLALSHKTFRGGFNFVEHFQNSQASKGHILDSVLRKVNIGDGVWAYFCDILVATDLRHEELVEEIRRGDTRYLSMGCVTDVVICSFCGQRIGDYTQPCFHLAYHKGHFLPDDDGVPRRIAELCGHKSLPGGGVRFVEASWVETPAFPGAVKRSIIADGWEGPVVQLKRSKEAGIKKAASQETELSTRSIEIAASRADLNSRLGR